jgi:hypothetical protein
MGEAIFKPFRPLVLISYALVAIINAAFNAVIRFNLPATAHHQKWGRGQAG